MQSHDPAGVTGLELVPLPVAAIEALAAGDLEGASAAAGLELTTFVLDERWLWSIRAEQLRRTPQDEEWVARLAVVDGEIVGHGGFHGAPDADGVVEVAYSVDPAHRRRGRAREILAALLERADGDERVRCVRASIRPDNAASLATIAPFGFTQVGEQWDEEDGLELVFERPAGR